MNHIYKEDMKPFLHNEIISTVEELKLTKEQAAEILGIEARTFAYLKSGKTMCSTTTLLIYLAKLCRYPVNFIDKLRSVVSEAEKY